MTLLVTVFASVISTLIWYTSEKARKMKIGGLCLAFWSASLMWLVDAVFEYLENGAEYFQPVFQDMINDAFLGFSAVALALTVWLTAVIIRNPKLK